MGIFDQLPRRYCNRRLILFIRFFSIQQFWVAIIAAFVWKKRQPAGEGDYDWELRINYELLTNVLHLVLTLFPVPEGDLH